MITMAQVSRPNAYSAPRRCTTFGVWLRGPGSDGHPGRAAERHFFLISAPSPGPMRWTVMDMAFSLGMRSAI